MWELFLHFYIEYGQKDNLIAFGFSDRYRFFRRLRVWWYVKTLADIFTVVLSRFSPSTVS